MEGGGGRLNQQSWTAAGHWGHKQHPSEKGTPSTLTQCSRNFLMQTKPLHGWYNVLPASVSNSNPLNARIRVIVRPSIHYPTYLFLVTGRRRSWSLSQHATGIQEAGINPGQSQEPYTPFTMVGVKGVKYKQLH